MDFLEHFLQIRPDILAVTEDDQYAEEKVVLCREVGAEYRVLAKTPPLFSPISSTEIVRFIRAPIESPLRIDFAGGWLDVPKLARDGGYVVNCAISPMVSLREWPYKRRAGLGGSGAYALLRGADGVASELNIGVGWQDPAVIFETGLCVWRSGERPSLELKCNGRMLAERMAIYWTGAPHDTPGFTNLERDYDLIFAASQVARDAVHKRDLALLAKAAQMSYQVQLGEGMEPLPEVPAAIARKYCGGGWGGYAVYLFDNPTTRNAFLSESNATAIEPYCRNSF